jgi:hypothetical protein
MSRCFVVRILAVAIAGFTAADVSHAQTFNVEKFDIKGDGGTDSR